MNNIDSRLWGLMQLSGLMQHSVVADFSAATQDEDKVIAALDAVEDIVVANQARHVSRDETRVFFTAVAATILKVADKLQELGMGEVKPHRPSGGDLASAFTGPKDGGGSGMQRVLEFT